MNSVTPKHQDFDWGHMLWLVDATLDPAATFSAAKMLVKPGKISDFHFHDNCSEFIFLEKGEGEVFVGDKVVALAQGGGVMIPMGTKHAIRNSGKELLELSLTYSAGKRNYTPCENE